MQNPVPFNDFENTEKSGWDHRRALENPKLFWKYSKNQTKRRNALRSLSQEEKKVQKHKIKVIKEQLNLDPPSKDYYKSLNIKPGFLFFSCLMRAPKASINTLSINIPEMLYYTDKIYYLYTNSAGKVQCTTNVNCYLFQNAVSKHKPAEEEAVTDTIAIIIRMPGEKEQDMNVSMMDWLQFELKMVANETLPYAMMQRYIKCASGRPSIVRLYYYAYEKTNRANFAYFINSLTFEDAEMQNNIQLCAVNTSKPRKIEIFKQSGTALLPYENEASKIIHYLNKGYNCRVQEIVLDFIRDSNGTVWLISCKRIIIDPSTFAFCLQPVKDFWPETHLANEDQHIKKLNFPINEEKRKGVLSFVHCKLCRLSYPNYELSNLVSSRVLLLFKNHVTLRSDLPLDVSHLKVYATGHVSQSVRICQLCYTLISSEFELIDAQKSLAEFVHITMKELTYDDDIMPISQIPFLPSELIQVRLLFYAINLWDIEKSTIKGTLYMHFLFFGSTVSFPILIDEDEQGISPIDIMRLNYLFYSPNKTLKKFFQNFILEIRITNGPKVEDSLLAQTSGKVLTKFPETLKLGSALYEKWQMDMFNFDRKEMCSLTLIIGLSFDKKVPSNRINVNLDKHHDAYIPEDHYMTVDPFPTQWMELFGVGNKLDETLGKQLEPEDFYSPHLTKCEMMKMDALPLSGRSSEKHKKNGSHLPLSGRSSDKDKRKEEPINNIIKNQPTINIRRASNYSATLEKPRKLSVVQDIDVYNIVDGFLTHRSSSTHNLPKGKTISLTSTPTNLKTSKVSMKKQKSYLEHVKSMNDYIITDMAQRMERYSTSTKNSFNSRAQSEPNL
ncbi:unnamed protein product [Blepharisma stoltei]|uniref:Uncharacterized protein n=1 Tax=Blepharisma stoltei TaxID=1481888 RepID=A0AAU9JCK8_9CILI|nr:unnamed protein product [Blepharisma stoltei]